jgi:transposase
VSRGLSLAPCGLVIERVESETDKLLLVARPITKTAACPTCGGISARIHSHSRRALADLPSQGRLVRIRLWTCRFRCAVAECQQKIFTEHIEGIYAVKTAAMSVHVTRAACSAAFSASTSSGRASVAATMHRMESQNPASDPRKSSCLRLSSGSRAEAGPRVAPIDPVEHVGQLRRRYGHHAVGR